MTPFSKHKTEIKKKRCGPENWPNTSSTQLRAHPNVLAAVTPMLLVFILAAVTPMLLDSSGRLHTLVLAQALALVLAPTKPQRSTRTYIP